jgi:hypothetical protein
VEWFGLCAAYEQWGQWGLACRRYNRVTWHQAPRRRIIKVNSYRIIRIQNTPRIGGMLTTLAIRYTCVSFTNLMILSCQQYHRELLQLFRRTSDEGTGKRGWDTAECSTPSALWTNRFSAIFLKTRYISRISSNNGKYADPFSKPPHPRWNLV